MKNLIIMTGMSGSGKSVALEAIEDMGYFCIDNLPPILIPKVIELMDSSDGKMSKLAIGIDLRGKEFFHDLIEQLDILSNNKDFVLRILFLDTADERLVSRYKETRRAHPLGGSVSLLDAIRQERKILDDLKGRSSKVIDTTDISPKELRDILFSLYSGGREEFFVVNVLSFGFKHGIPIDADLMFDVRFLPNPYYLPELRPLTGLDDRVYNYVMKWQDTDTFYEKLKDMISFLIPQYVKEGKSQLTIAIGCTGGQHRSVALAKRLGEDLNTQFSFKINTAHRDAKIEGQIDV
ncbi:RNase adapter RapZ [Jeotgalicoccus meleagridis]|uniref:GlmZ(SRNA)-inactivating NTPase n=1 Tax=Jeotgalicoccus meleagridis TaxID=2759181 RepID=A0A6V7RPW7_9STAP|nr:RNase adapter RapZ [Jeotgalicoccus meleagridis]CAD2080210.1 glmZ(sRNA)-inactivating NTPase [Jeotgalicoccus meleagridis]